MMERVGSTYHSLQGLQANRSFQQAEPKTGSVFRQALAQELQALPQKPQPNVQPPPPMPDPLAYEELPPAPPPRQRSQPVQRPAALETSLQSMVQDVRQIAEASGFIGVSDQDVLRAYRTGQSFLADYTV